VGIRQWLTRVFGASDDGEAERRHQEQRADQATVARVARSQARAQWVAAGIAVLTLVVGFVALRSSSDEDGGAPAVGAGGLAQLEVASTWPLLSGCDGATAVAAPASGRSMEDLLALASRPGDERAAVIEHGGGAWGEGHLYLHLSSSTANPIAIVNLRPRMESSAVAPPSAIYEPEGGCGETYERIFDLALDEPSLIDQGVVGEPQAAMDDEPPREEDLGPGFVVTESEPATIRIDTSACHGNYRWSLDVTYSVDGVVDRTSVGPFLSFGLAEQATGYRNEYGPGSPISVWGEVDGPAC
jgi:hypothetical protein